MKSLLIALLCFGSFACSTPQSVDKKNDKSSYYLQIGISEMMRKDYRASLLNLNEAKKLSPENAAVRNNVGLAYFGLEQYSLAEVEFIAALNFEPKYTEAKNNLGALYVTTGNYKKAIDILSEATLDLTYEKPDRLWLNLGLAYFYTKDYTRSETAFLKALDLKPQHCEASHYYARALFEKQSYKLSAQAFDRAVDRCKDFDEPYFYGALAYMKLKNNARASGRLRELLDEFPKSNFNSRAKKLLEML